MPTVRAWRLLAALLLLTATAGCERPTAPELLATTDRVGREFRDDPEAAIEWLSQVMLDGNYARMIPALGVVPVSIDGAPPRGFGAYVVEYVAVPLDPDDGFPCPRVRRTLYAVWTERRGFTVNGADFTRPIGAWEPGCEVRTPLGRPVWQAPWWPVAHGILVADGVFGSAVEGRAAIDPLGTVAGPCDFLRRPFTPQPAGAGVDCETAAFLVSGDLVFTWRPADRAPGLGTPDPRRPSRVVFAPHPVPGIRLTFHCTKESQTFGCAPAD